MRVKAYGVAPENGPVVRAAHAAALAGVVLGEAGHIREVRDAILDVDGDGLLFSLGPAVDLFGLLGGATCGGGHGTWKAAFQPG